MLPEEVLNSYRDYRAHFDLDAFCGTWYVLQTNLAMWKTRANPTITYTRLPSDNGTRLLDVVAYTSGGKAEQISGIDHQDRANPRLFLWRGDRWYTRWLSSAWCVVDHDPACEEWAVTYFSRTWVTSAGMDLYARTPSLDAARMDEILARFRSHPYLRAQASTLFLARHEVGC